MNEEQWLRQLADRAGSDRPPHVDVADRVLADLRLDAGTDARPLAWVAGVSVAAAMIVVVYAADAWSSWRDPLTETLASLDLVLR